MVYVTGDTHGDLDRFKDKRVACLKKNDTLVICGDFGFIWDGSKAEKKALSWLSRRKYVIVFVEGAHENYNILSQYETVDFCGGRARQIEKNIYQLLRGEIYEIEGKSWFAFGGGDDEEIDITQFEESDDFTRLPTEDERERALENLSAHGNRVDYIVTHDVGYKLKSFLKMESVIFNNLHAFLEEITVRCSFGKWYFGCYHIDKRVPPNYFCVYKEVLEADSGREDKK